MRNGFEGASANPSGKFCFFKAVGADGHFNGEMHLLFFWVFSMKVLNWLLIRVEIVAWKVNKEKT